MELLSAPPRINRGPASIELPTLVHHLSAGVNIPPSFVITSATRAFLEAVILPVTDVGQFKADLFGFTHEWLAYVHDFSGSSAPYPTSLTVTQVAMILIAIHEATLSPDGMISLRAQLSDSDFAMTPQTIREVARRYQFDLHHQQVGHVLKLVRQWAPQQSACLPPLNPPTRKG